MVLKAQSHHLKNFSAQKPLSGLKTLAIAANVGILLAQAFPARAVDVEVTPANPKQGDTISVIIQQDPSRSANPTVSVGEKSYPTFVVGTGRFRAFIPTTPLDSPKTLRIKAGIGGETKTLAVQLRSRKFPIQRINLPPGKAGLEATQLELSRVAAFKQLATPEKFWSSAFINPNKGRFSTGYGVRRYYNGKFAQDYYHRGVDYAGGYGSPVVAPAAGRVALVGREKQGFRVHGNVIGIDHGQGVTSIFMHLSRIDVKEGDTVKAGQVIGAIGSTGASTGPHLHWGLYVNGLSVDPAAWRSQTIE